TDAACSFIGPRLCYSRFVFSPRTTTYPYTLSLHDALPISAAQAARALFHAHEGQQPLDRPRLLHRGQVLALEVFEQPLRQRLLRSEEHTSELQSPDHLVCRLLLEKKKK